jgi:CubicO group peptidase (beta-lactamase class C family)
MPQFSAYHGVTGSGHQTQFNNLSSQGYRMISLSVYGDPTDARYAAVWIKRPGPAWVAIHGTNAAGYQEFFNKQTAQGFAPVLVTATGPVANAVFAAVFEHGVNVPWFARHGLISGPDDNPGTLQFQFRWAQQNGFIPHSVAIYGTNSDKRYAGVWVKNTTGAHWSWRTADPASDYQKWFNAFTQLPYRPAYVTLSTNQLYLSVFRDDSVGEWIARHGLSSDDYQNEFNQRTAQGFYPICVQGGGVGANTRYAAIFAKEDVPRARQWSVTGQAIPALAAFDAAVKDYMQDNAIRAGTLAIAKNGVLKFARAYTWAEPGYPITQPTSPFRLASCSKAFTCAALQALYDANALQPGTKVFPLLGITSAALPSQTPDPNINTITVQQLIDHAGGWDRGVAGFDPVFSMRKIAQALQLSGPPNKRDLARYMYGEPLQFAPGTNSKYSNFGYVLMALIVEKVTGRAFIDYLKTTVLTPEGITDVFLARTLRTQRLSNEGFYDDPGLGLTVLQPTVEQLVPYAYGGEGWTTESMDGGGGLAATATALTQFIHRHAVWGMGGRAAGAARSGGMAGTSSLAVSRGDGVDYAFIFNTRNIPQAASETFGNRITTLLDTTALP